MQATHVLRGVCLTAACLPFTATLAGDLAERKPSYFDWKAENYAIQEPLGGLKGDPQRGRDIAADQSRGNCVACHQLPIPEAPFHGNLGPPLAGIASRQSVGMIRLHIVDQTRFNPETVMPGYYRPPSQLNRLARELQGQTFLTAQQIEDLVAYLVTLK
jgi:sulfur-oxidizing protein SoxX